MNAKDALFLTLGDRRLAAALACHVPPILPGTAITPATLGAAAGQ
jgi:hypothetical protein